MVPKTTIKTLLVISLVMFFTIRPPLDLDLGWHLRYGEHFFQTGTVLRENSISFVWPQYRWVQASWAYDLVVYQLFRWFGFFGLSVFASVIMAVVFFLTIGRKAWFPASVWVFLLVIFLTQTDAIYSAGLRAQTVSTVFFTMLLIALVRKRYVYLPAIFLFWSNFHGGVVLGLLVLLVMLGVSFMRAVWKKKFKQARMLGLVLVVSFAASVINPWGLSLHREALRHTTKRNISIIEEWKPRTQYTDAALITGVIFVFTCAIAVKKGKKSDVPFLAAYVIVTFLAFAANRFAVNFGVMSVLYLSQTIGARPFRPKALLWVNGVGAIFAAVLFVDAFFFQQYVVPFQPGLLRFSWADYCQTTLDCSEEISMLMRQDPPVGNGIHPYNFGGYLSWRAPQVKTFVDGRMAAWTDGGTTPPIVESTQLDSPSAPLVFRKLDGMYQFRWAIVYSSKPLSEYLTAQPEWHVNYADSVYTYLVKR